MWAEFEDFKKHLKSGIHHVKGYEPGTESITFYCNDGYAVTMYHEEDCCETVRLEDDDGLTNYTDIFTGCKWCEVDMSIMGKNEDDYGDQQWTFYLFRTDKGYDTMRWYGESNGYYSIEVAYQIDTWDSNRTLESADDVKKQMRKEYLADKKEALADAMTTIHAFCSDYFDCESYEGGCPFLDEETGDCLFQADSPEGWKIPDELLEKDK